MNNIIRTIHKATMFILTFAVCTLAVFATAPANDNLASSEVIAGNSGSVSDTTVDATREGNEGAHGAISNDIVYRTVWYSWTATEDKPVVFEITSSNFDSSIAIYTGSNFPLALQSANNNTFGDRPRVEIEAIAGTTYRIVVGLSNLSNGPGGSFTLQWNANNAPTNDNFANALVLPSDLSGNVAVSNQNATKETGEPNHVAGTRSIWVTFTNSAPFDYAMSFRTRRYSMGIETTLAVYTGTSVDNLTAIVKNDNRPAQAVSEVRFLARSGVTYRIAIDGNGGNTDQWSTVLEWGINPIKEYTDFGTRSADARMHYDDAADVTIFRPSTGVWWMRNSHIPSNFSAVQFGAAGDTPVQGDYDGDGRTDLAVARDTPEGKIWYIANSFDGTYTIVQWGVAGDKPVTGDYDFDGRVDLAVFRPSDGIWYIRKSTDGNAIVKPFGLQNDIPVTGNFKGTQPGSDIAVFRPSDGTFYVLNEASTMYIPFGVAGDQPVVSDYDHDGYADPAVFRPTTRTWYIRRSSSNTVQYQQWGLADDIPMTGDYDNNTNDLSDFAVFRPSESRWYILRSEGSQTEIFDFGAAGDIPASSPNMLAN